MIQIQIPRISSSEFDPIQNPLSKLNCQSGFKSDFDETCLNVAQICSFKINIWLKSWLKEKKSKSTENGQNSIETKMIKIN